MIEKQLIDLMDVMQKELCCKNAVEVNSIQLLEESYDTKFSSYQEAISYLRKKIINSDECDDHLKLELISRLQSK